MKEQNYDKGQESGYCVLYHYNGKKKSEGKMLNGEKVGTWKSYDLIGQPRTIVEF